jgi:hypothetical protein
MRLTTLLLLIVAVLLLTAPAASFAQTSRPPKFDSAFTGDDASILRLDGSGLLQSGDLRSLPKFDTGDTHVTCLTMRTYVVARENPNSDVTHRVGYYECIPAWKFDMRKTDQKQEGVSQVPEKR